MSDVQEIAIGDERAVLVPIDTWRELMGLFEELEDELLFDRAVGDPNTELVEHDELCRRLGRSPLRYLRQRSGLSQAELARRSKLSQAFIARVESGDKRLSDRSRSRVARALRVPTGDLIW